MAANPPLKVLFLSAEVVPFAKTGGLADVAGSLPKAIRALGHDVRVCMPRYGRIDRAKFGLTEVVPAFDVPMDHHTEPASIWQGTIGRDVPVYLVDNAPYFDRDGIYMYPDDAERFIFWCRAALEMLRRPELDWQPDIIHCNDWHTAIIPNWMRTIYKDDPFFARAATVYTIHNLAYQGIFGHRVLEVAGLDEYGFLYHPEMADMAEVVDLMARGIYFADVVSTVSERYAQEILTPEYGERMDPLLRDRRDHLFGILNGIDHEIMDPAGDQYLAARFDAQRLEARAANKAALQREAGLPEAPTTPLVGVISRLTDQKGFDLISQIIDPLMSHVDMQFVLLGTGDQRYHDLFSAVAQRYPQRAAVFLTFNAPLAQRIYGGSDMFLMPSRFEPCGLGQMIAMRYGSVPVVRATGGLADTVVDYDPRSGRGNGFVFEAYDAMALFATLVRAAETYKHEAVWRQLMLRGMAEDFSWARSAGKYVDLYYRALAAKIPREARPLDEYGIGDA
ncbi:MAG TPA: glycogen/starch synthase [Anaerolineae bacterium]|nr:glycogen/starch synthase [Anaerolineae bacterium]HPL28206.1 glycogen/starch synthase [Anaerolineae bacterium]